jgi:hypothetical protein
VSVAAAAGRRGLEERAQDLGAAEARRRRDARTRGVEQEPVDVALEVVEETADEEGAVEDRVPAVEGVVVGLLLLLVVVDGVG